MYNKRSYDSDSTFKRNGYNKRSNFRGGRDKRNSGRDNDGFEPMTENEPVQFEKNFYKPTNVLTAQQAEEFRKKHEMRLTGQDINLPVCDFKSLGFPEQVVANFEKKGFKDPTAIQAQGWPMALSGRDMVGIAATGSGKTLSFVLPALMHAQNQCALRENDGPIVLILAPTRELVNQIQEVVAEYAPYFRLKSAGVYGGASIMPQKRAIVNGCEVLVATPGRLIDLHDQGFCPLGRVSFLVLDEADRMLDMGFEPQLKKIIPKTNSGRQTLMWSATWPREVRNLANDYMDTFIQVNIGDERLKANIKISQKVEVMSWRDKKQRLLDCLKNSNKTDRVIVFCNMKRTCDVIESFLSDENFRAAAIHGDKSQAARDSVIVNFKNGKRNVLIATDVAARGLDIEDVKLVINYDFPKVVDDYVHRIGRTARGSCMEGKAVTFVTDEDAPNMRKLIDILNESKQEVPEELTEMVSRGRGRNNNNNRSFGNSRGRSSYGGSGKRFGY